MQTRPGIVSQQQLLIQTTSLHGQLNFATLQEGMREMLGRMRHVMMKSLQFQCHSRAIHLVAECHNVVMTEIEILLSYAETDYIRQ
jgi:hypothetical protein